MKIHEKVKNEFSQPQPHHVPNPIPDYSTTIQLPANSTKAEIIIENSILVYYLVWSSII